MTTCYTVPEIWCVTDVSFSFWSIFCPFTPLTAQKIPADIMSLKKKNKKNPADIMSVNKCTKNHIISCTVPEIWHMTDLIVIF